VHAGYVVDLSPGEFPDHVLRWSLLEDPDPEPHCSGKTVIVGHTEQRDGEVLDLGCVKCIDTYCHGYGWLTAIDVISGTLWQASRWGAMRDGDPVLDLQRAKKLLKLPLGKDRRLKTEGLKNLAQPSVFNLQPRMRR